jgi:hypothetical protein
MNLLTRGTVRTEPEEPVLPPVHEQRRVAELARVLGCRATASAVAEAAGDDQSRWWLVHSVLRAELPLATEVSASRRTAVLDGPYSAWVQVVALADRAAAAAAEALREDADPGDGATEGRPEAPEPPLVRVVEDGTVLDVHHTAQTGFFTGIQRVVVETVRRWDRDHDVLLVGWDEAMTRLEVLPTAARDRVLGRDTATTTDAADGTDGTGRADGTGALAPGTVVVPWGGAFVVPELAADPPRTTRLSTLFELTPARTGLIAYDCVPVTTAETCAPGMPGAFSRMLAAASRSDAIAPISHSAAAEYRGWVRMLASTGRPGPAVRPVPLPLVPPSGEVGQGGDAALLRWPGRHLVLVVGSHEPRKNHLAVLAAAETLWQEGLPFHLVFIGGNAWRSERFTAELGRLAAVGRPVRSIRAVSDELLSTAYREARVLLFPSLNEGFGLPPAEALAVGTPVIVSGHGSLAEIAEGGGALTVDPRDDDDITDRLREVLLDDGLHARLSAAAAARPHGSWDDYASAAWDALVGGPA